MPLSDYGPLLAISPFFPVTNNPNDAAAITSVLTSLLAGAPPPRVDVMRFSSERTNALGYPNGMLRVAGKCRAYPGDVLGWHVWYCCARYGRAIPVSEWELSVGAGSPRLYDASPLEFFATHVNRPYELTGEADGWKQIYDDAYAALT